MKTLNIKTETLRYNKGFQGFRTTVSDFPKEGYTTDIKTFKAKPGFDMQVCVSHEERNTLGNIRYAVTTPKYIRNIRHYEGRATQAAMEKAHDGYIASSEFRELLDTIAYNAEEIAAR